MRASINLLLVASGAALLIGCPVADPDDGWEGEGTPGREVAKSTPPRPTPVAETAAKPEVKAEPAQTPEPQYATQAERCAARAAKCRGRGFFVVLPEAVTGESVEQVSRKLGLEVEVSSLCDRGIALESSASFEGAGLPASKWFSWRASVPSEQTAKALAAGTADTRSFHDTDGYEEHPWVVDGLRTQSRAEAAAVEAKLRKIAGKSPLAFRLEDRSSVLVFAQCVDQQTGLMIQKQLRERKIPSKLLELTKVDLDL